MPSCIKCGADAGSGSVVCGACDDRPSVAIDAATERRSPESMILRSDSLRAVDKSRASQHREQSASIQHDRDVRSDEKKESMIEAILRLEEREEKKGFTGAVLTILSLLFGGWS